MTTLTKNGQTMPRRAKGDDRPPRNDVVVKMDAEVVRIAKTVASFRGITLAEYLSETVRPIAHKDFDDMHVKKGRRE